MVRCALIDDEPLALDILKRYLADLPGYAVVGAFTKPLEGLHFLQTEGVDLLFVDIQMPGLTGLEMIRTIPHPPAVIITSAYRDHAVEGFELQVVDYLVKPFSYERFLKALNRLGSLGGAATPSEVASDFVFIRENRAMVKVRLSDILYVESLKNYVRIKTTQKEIIPYHTLGYMEDKLPAAMFLRIHKSFLVNIEKIDRSTGDEIEIAGTRLPVGKSYREAVVAAIARRSI